MKNVKLIIEYDGTNYHGWQSQLNAVSVHDVVRKAIVELTGEQCSLIGASRTDAGVHSLGQTANFTTCSSIPADRFSYALNRLLPEDIVIKKSEEVSSGFHARFSARGKKYRYLIYNSSFPSALLRNRAFHVSSSLDGNAMLKAAGYIKGKHDFSAFSASGGSAKTSVKTITDIDLSFDGDIIKLEIAGDGFLYNMVRIIAGTLVEVGTGRIPADSMKEIIEGLDRRKAGKTAPAHGLYLVEVYY